MSANRRADARNGGFYKCEECSKAFNRMASYEAHIRMHALDELDAYDVVFNFSGKMHESDPNFSTPRRETRGYAALAKSASTTPEQQRKPAVQKKSPVPPVLDNSPLLKRALALSPSDSFLAAKPAACSFDIHGQDTPTAIRIEPATSSRQPQQIGPDIPPNEPNKPQVLMTLPSLLLQPTSQKSNDIVKKSPCSVSNSVVQPPKSSVIIIESGESSSESEFGSLMVKVPLKVCSEKVLRKPVINLRKQDGTVDSQRQNPSSKLLHENTTPPQSLAPHRKQHEHPVPQLPVQKQPVSQLPLQKQPVYQPPVQPVSQLPVKKEPVQKQPVSQLPVKKEPAQKQPVSQLPVKKEPVQKQPVSQLPVKKEPVQKQPVSHLPVKKEPVQKQPVQKQPQPVQNQSVQQHQQQQQQANGKFVVAIKKEDQPDVQLTSPPPKKVAKVIRLETVSLPKSPDMKKRVLHDDSLKLEKIPLKGKRTRHPQRKPPVECPVCHRLLSSKNSLKRHNLIHTGEKPFKCTSCDRAFTQPHHLEKHMQCYHPTKEPCGGSVSSSISSSSPDKEEKGHKCSVCNMKFSRLRMFKSHLTSHDNDRPFKCDMCSMRFKKQLHLSCHMQTHTREKTCVCHYCSKRFYRQSQVERHMQVHFHEEAYTNAVTGDVMYMCKYCPKVCRTASGLSKHHTIHALQTQKRELPPIREEGEVFPGSVEMAADSTEEILGITDTETEGEFADVSGEGVTEESMDESELSQKDGLFGGESELSTMEDSEDTDGGMSPFQMDSGDSSDEKDFIRCSSREELSDGGDGSNPGGAVTYLHMPYRNPHNHKKGKGAVPPAYKCEWCGRMFLKRGYLIEHYRLHQQVPHQCELCGKVFMSLRYLKRHMRSKHGRK